MYIIYKYIYIYIYIKADLKDLKRYFFEIPTYQFIKVHSSYDSRILVTKIQFLDIWKNHIIQHFQLF